jgi:hypothetical protein
MIRAALGAHRDPGQTVGTPTLLIVTARPARYLLQGRRAGRVQGQHAVGDLRHHRGRLLAGTAYSAAACRSGWLDRHGASQDVNLSLNSLTATEVVGHGAEGSRRQRPLDQRGLRDRISGSSRRSHRLTAPAVPAAPAAPMTLRPLALPCGGGRGRNVGGTGASWPGAAACPAYEPATSVQVTHQGEQIVTIGPFPESREYLGGWVIIDVAHLDAALQWAVRWPGPKSGPTSSRAGPHPRSDDPASSHGIGTWDLGAS